MRALPFVLATLLLAPGCGGRSGSGAAPAGPHVLLVTVDTLRADHLGCYGYARDTSPALDALAREGVVFEQAFCTMPTTVPSHASIFTGTWPLVHGATSNFRRLDADADLAFLQRELADAGWRAAAFVSMEPLAKALDPFGGFEHIDRPAGHDRSSEEVVDAALAWLDAHDADTPFFLWLHLWDPHTPYRLHPDLMPRFRAGFVDDLQREHGFVAGHYDDASLAKMVDLYDNEVAHVDRELGRLLADLDRRGLGADTLVVVTSDHGESLDELYVAEGYAFDHGEFLYDHQLRVPLIVRSPDRGDGVAGAGARVARPFGLTDLAPTILAACGLDVPAAMHGEARPGDLAGRPEAGAEYVFVQRRIAGRQSARPFLVGDLVGARGPRHKLLRNLTVEAEELHANGREDRARPLDDAAAREALAAELDAWLAFLAGVRSAGGAPVDERTRGQLHGLGYVDEDDSVEEPDDAPEGGGDADGSGETGGPR